MRSDTYYMIFGFIFIICVVVMFISGIMYVWTGDYMFMKVFFTSFVSFLFSVFIGKSLE